MDQSKPLSFSLTQGSLLILQNSLAMVSASFSHQFFVGQKINTEQPSASVSKHSGMIWSSSPFTVVETDRLRIFCKKARDVDLFL